MDNEIARWNSLNEVNRVRQLMDRFWSGYPRVAREDVELGGLDVFLPVDIFEKDGNIVVKAALPGVKPEEIDVKVSDGTLLIRAETRAEENVNDSDYYRREYRHGKLERSFRLPHDLDTQKGTADYKNGILVLTFPKIEAPKSKSIQVKVR